MCPYISCDDHPVCVGSVFPFIPLEGADEPHAQALVRRDRRLNWTPGSATNRAGPATKRSAYKENEPPETDEERDAILATRPGIGGEEAMKTSAKDAFQQALRDELYVEVREIQYIVVCNLSIEFLSLQHKARQHGASVKMHP